MFVYNVPALALDRYQDKVITFRSDDARAMVEVFSSRPQENLLSLQVLSMGCDVDALLHLSDSLPIDLVVDHPATESPLLYRFAELSLKHPVRVTVRAAPGMIEAVNIAQALNFSVKLEINQPEQCLVDELLELIEYYLHGSTVTRPIEPFHSLFFSFYSGKPTSLWSIQEEDPAVDRYVTDDERVTFSRRLVSLRIPEDQFDGFLTQSISAFQEDEECSACDFFSRCQSFFKLPDKSYRCEHSKQLFVVLSEAAMKLRQHEEQFIALDNRENMSSLDPKQSPHPSEMNRPTPTVTTDCSNVLEATGVVQHVPSSFFMRRLNDHPPKQFVRLSWADAEAEAVWGARIREVCACITELEWRSILEGVRVCALTSVDPNELHALRLKLTPYGLTVAPLEKIAKEDCYISSIRNARDGEPFNYWCAIGRVSDVRLMESAHASHDEEAVGRLLGYPACCIGFHNRVWIDERFVDTTWPMAQNTVKKKSITPTHVEIPEVSGCNVLLRWLGPRIVFHLPCSFECRSTVELADKFTEIARSAGFHLEMDWLEEMLHWPVEWTALHGLAEIKTAMVTISTVTDVTAETYRVSYAGAATPGA